MAVKPKIGLLGGSFDPVHNAHIELALAAIDSLGLSSLQLIPASQPWQKEGLLASSKQRLAMLKLASQGMSKIKVNPLEINRSGATYTIDTLELLPVNASYYWVMGSDQLENFCSWYRWQDIIKLVDIAVAKRPNSKLKAPAQLVNALAGKSILEIPFSPMAISATEIRARLQTGADCSAFLNQQVLSYIESNNIYQSLTAN